MWVDESNFILWDNLYLKSKEKAWQKKALNRADLAWNWETMVIKSVIFDNFKGRSSI